MIGVELKATAKAKRCVVHHKEEAGHDSITSPTNNEQHEENEIPIDCARKATTSDQAHTENVCSIELVASVVLM